MNYSNILEQLQSDFQKSLLTSPTAKIAAPQVEEYLAPSGDNSESQNQNKHA